MICSLSQAGKGTRAVVFDIDHIRAELNELPFKDGRREVLFARISELFEGEDDNAVREHLRRLEQELGSHALMLSRYESDQDALFVVQELRTIGPDFSWMAEAMNWVSKITTVVLEMVLPGLAGLWLDSQWGTRFLTLVGFALGVPLGLWHLISMTRIKLNHHDDGDE
jgi:hypothetical protein